MKCAYESQSCEGPVTEQPDPYELDVNNRTVYIEICEYHYGDIAADI